VVESTARGRGRRGASWWAWPEPLALWPRLTEVNLAISPIFASPYDKNELPVPDALKQAQEAVAGVLGVQAVR
jgi:hypothetical protein